MTDANTHSRSDSALQAARAEITAAIREVTDEKNNGQRAVIRTLPLLPRFRYRYTCPRCSCHVVSHFNLPSTMSFKNPWRICMHCGHEYETGQVRQRRGFRRFIKPRRRLP